MKEISLSSTDVHNCFGLPIGGLHLDPSEFRHDSALVEQFKIHFPKAMANKRFVIRPSHVSDLILESNAGGDMFKRNFVILFYSLIVDSQKSGVLSLKILQYLSDVSKIRDYDWCDLIFRDALEFRIDWARSNESIFRGHVFLYTV